MKPTLIYFFSFFLPTIVFSQNIDTIINTTTFDYPIGASLGSKNYIFYLERNLTDSKQEGFLAALKYNSITNTYQKSYIDTLNNHFAPCFYNFNENYLFLGHSLEVLKDNLFISIYNQELERIFEKTIVLDTGFPSIFINDVKIYGNNIYLFANKYPINTQNVYILKLDFNFNLLNIKEISYDSDGLYPCSLSIANDTISAWTYKFSGIVCNYNYLLDTNFNVLDTFDLEDFTTPTFSSFYLQAKTLLNGNQVVFGNCYSLYMGGESPLGVRILNNQMEELKKTIIIAQYDSLKQDMERCMDFVYEDKIYILATHGYDNSGTIPQPWQQTPAYIYLARLDAELNVVWERYFGDGEYYYTGNMVYATNDGGAVILGTFYDYNTVYEKDLVIIKVDENGNLTTNIENKPQNLHNALLYPNPAKETLNLRTAVQYVPATLEVYNISGIKVLTENITATEQTINIASLTTGNYIFRIIFQNETIETGKFIVE